MKQNKSVYLMLLPVVTVIAFLFIGGFVLGLLQSLNFNPFTGKLTDISLKAYVEVINNDAFTESFFLTFWISTVSTILAITFAIFSSMAIRKTRFGKSLTAFIYQIPIPMPYIVVAVGAMMLLSQSGLISRFAYMIGLIKEISDFPVLVYDRFGIGIIFVFLWKQIPYIGIIVLSILQSVATDYEEVAFSLGANKIQSFFHVLLPLILPGIVPASIVCFSFSFGTYEVPFLLGQSSPRMLSVLSYQLYENLDMSSRPQAMAISIFIAVFVMIFVVIYQKVAYKLGRRS
jgi:putative spermidine/putrescine transport system permease protein